MTTTDKSKTIEPKPRTRKTGPTVFAKANIHLWNELIGAVMI